MVGYIYRSMGFDVLEKATSLLKKREEAIASNIANVDTPFYKALRVAFEERLREVVSGGDRMTLVKTHENHINNVAETLEDVKPLYYRKLYPVRNDMNSVDIDNEMSEYAVTHLRYNTIVSSYSFSLGMLKYVITGGRR